MAIINVMCSVANILGVWAYRLIFKETPFKKMLVLTTCCFALAQLAKLLVTQGLTERVLGLSAVTYTYLN